MGGSGSARLGPALRMCIAVSAWQYAPVKKQSESVPEDASKRKVLNLQVKSGVVRARFGWPTILPR